MSGPLPAGAPQRVAVLSLHTSPLTQPGSGDSGGMNVYVRELAASLAHRGIDVTVYVRRWATNLPDEVTAEPGVRVVHIDAGPVDLAKERLPEILDEFADGVMADLRAIGGACVLHANYWLSAVAGHRIKHEMGIPLVSTFHTLARAKAENGDIEPEFRARSEAEVIACSDAVTASCSAETRWLERLYFADPERIWPAAPGVEHALFSPGNQAFARRAIGVEDRPTALFVGRIQPLKGVALAVEAMASLTDTSAQLVIIGGPSGADGEAELRRVHAIIDEFGLADNVRFVEPVPHHLLSSWYRAADVCVIPSRSESFGLVALEASACATPVVASSVGGLRTLVIDGETGFLVNGRNPAEFGAQLDRLLSDRLRAAEMAMNAVEHASHFSWTRLADQLIDCYVGLRCQVAVDCS